MTKKSNFIRIAAAPIVMSGMMLAYPAPAAAASDDATSANTESSGVQEIVVTARKRTERQVDVPTSLSVFTANDLENQQIKGIDGLSNSVPSLFYQQRGGLETAISIRGVGGDPRNVGLESGVSVAIDGATVGRTNSYNTGLYEIEQIEVLRGPQGTLFVSVRYLNEGASRNSDHGLLWRWGRCPRRACSNRRRSVGSQSACGGSSFAIRRWKTASKSGSL